MYVCIGVESHKIIISPCSFRGNIFESLFSPIESTVLQGSVYMHVLTSHMLGYTTSIPPVLSKN